MKRLFLFLLLSSAAFGQCANLTNAQLKAQAASVIEMLKRQTEDDAMTPGLQAQVDCLHIEVSKRLKGEPIGDHTEQPGHWYPPANSPHGSLYWRIRIGHLWDMVGRLK